MSDSSIVSVLQLWQLCTSPARGVSDDHGLGAFVSWHTLRHLLASSGPRLEVLQCDSMEDLLRQHFGVRHGGHVSFLHYWRGMEAILQACGSFRSGGGVDAVTERQIDGLRRFREQLLQDVLLDRPPYTCSVVDLQSLCDSIALSHDAHVRDYWELKSRDLAQGETKTLGDIASTLVLWLQELLGDFLPEHQSGHASMNTSTDSADSVHTHRRGAPFAAETQPAQPRPEAAPGGALHREPMSSGMSWHRASALAPQSRLHGPSSRSSLQGLGQVSTTASRSATHGTPVSSATRPARSAAAAFPLPPDWLAAARGAQDEEAELFRERLVWQLGAEGADLSGEALTARQLYRSVKSALRAGRPAAPVAEPLQLVPPGVWAGAAQLSGLVCRRLRGPLQSLEKNCQEASAAQQPLVHLRVELLASQARAAALLERRVAEAPGAFGLAHLLGKLVRLQRCGALVHWRTSTQAGSSRSVSAGPPGLPRFESRAPRGARA